MPLEYKSLTEEGNLSFRNDQDYQNLLDSVATLSPDQAYNLIMDHVQEEKHRSVQNLQCNQDTYIGVLSYNNESPSRKKNINFAIKTGLIQKSFSESADPDIVRFDTINIGEGYTSQTDSLSPTYFDPVLSIEEVLRGFDEWHKQEYGTTFSEHYQKMTEKTLTLKTAQTGEAKSPFNDSFPEDW